MSNILYYSTFCSNCEKLIQKIGKNPDVRKETHFICIDKRKKGNNGATYIILENNQELLLPPTVTQVPALLLLNKGYSVILGNDIYNHFQDGETDYTRSPMQQQQHKQQQQQQQQQSQGEPMAFSLGSVELIILHQITIVF